MPWVLIGLDGVAVLLVAVVWYGTRGDPNASPPRAWPWGSTPDSELPPYRIDAPPRRRPRRPKGGRSSRR